MMMMTVASTAAHIAAAIAISRSVSSRNVVAADPHCFEVYSREPFPEIRQLCGAPYTITWVHCLHIARSNNKRHKLSVLAKMRCACFILLVVALVTVSCLGALGREADVGGKPRKFATEDHAEGRAGALSSKPVKIGFYSESLCPYCRQFTSELLAPMFTNGLSRIAEIDFYPFGNARYNEARS